MNIKQKVKIRIKQLNIDIFSNQILLELYRLFVLDYLNQDDNSERFKAKGYYFSRRIIDN